MIGLDTNVLVRLLAGDDLEQRARARAAIERSCSVDDPAFVNHVVIVETVWVLESAYSYAPHDIAAAIEGVLRTSTISTQAADVVWSALRSYRSGVDFADALLASINEHAGCEKTFTFDRKAAKQLQHFSHLI